MSDETTAGRGPAVILCEPQMGENIGAAARAMANFGLRDLRIVRPRDGWPNEKATANAAKALHIIETTRVYERVEDAVADLAFVYATTARDRDVTKAVRGPVHAARHIRELEAQGAAVGLLFGRERWGLDNDEVALADEILTLPVDPEFASLNIAQAVLVVAYEWRKAGFDDPDAALPFGMSERSPLATKEEIVGFFEHLESALDERTFFRPPEKRPIMIRNLRAIFQRQQLTKQEVRTLRGIVTALDGKNFRPRKDGAD
jgi:tRNA/rRNA methyltransferase